MAILTDSSTSSRFFNRSGHLCVQLVRYGVCHGAHCGPPAVTTSGAGPRIVRLRSPGRRPRRSARSATTASAWRRSRRGSGSPRPRCTATTRASTNCSATRCSVWASSWWTARRSPAAPQPSDPEQILHKTGGGTRRHRDGQPRVGWAVPLGRPLSARRRPGHADRADAHRAPPNPAAARAVIRPELTSRQRWTAVDGGAVA